MQRQSVAAVRLKAVWTASANGRASLEADGSGSSSPSSSQTAPTRHVASRLLHDPRRVATGSSRRTRPRTRICGRRTRATESRHEHRGQGRSAMFATAAGARRDNVDHVFGTVLDIECRGTGHAALDLAYEQSVDIWNGQGAKNANGILVVARSHPAYEECGLSLGAPPAGHRRARLPVRSAGQGHRFSPTAHFLSSLTPPRPLTFLHGPSSVVTDGPVEVASGQRGLRTACVNARISFALALAGPLLSAFLHVPTPSSYGVRRLRYSVKKRHRFVGQPRKGMANVSPYIHSGQCRCFGVSHGLGGGFRSKFVL